MDGTNQNNQKAIVAFIAGLLIGGLLIWVFSAGNNTGPKPEDGAAGAAVSDAIDQNADSGDGELQSSGNPDVTQNTEPASDVVVQSEGVIDVPDQTAGNAVVLNDVSYPSEQGWLVVYEVKEDALGNALGAARYNITDGLTPTSIELLRSTEAGKVYRVVFHAEDGDKIFNLTKDRPLVSAGGVMLYTSFRAQ